MQDLTIPPKHQGSPHNHDGTPRSIYCLWRSLRGEDQHILEGLIFTIRGRFPCDPEREELTTIAYSLMMSWIKQAKARENLQRLTARITGAPIHPPFP